MGYFDAQDGAQVRTAFRTAEKLYKRYKTSSTNLRTSKYRKTVPPTDLSQVLDFRKFAEVLKDGTRKVDGVSLATGVQPEKAAFVIDGHPGFYFIPQALSVAEQFRWIRESLASFPQPPNRTNHNTVYGPINDLWTHVQKQHFLVEDNANDVVCSEDLPPERESWCPHEDGITAEPCDDRLMCAGQLQAVATETAHPDERVGCRENAETAWHDADVPPITVKDEACGARVIHEKPEEGRLRWRFVDEAKVRGASFRAELGKPISAESLIRKLRWATIGQQFDWAKKCYNTMLPYKRLPDELSELSARLAEPAMKGEKFLAQGAIVNYYGPDDMLGGHIDDMEADWSKPIVSISLGCKAVFLLGGTSRDETPVAMFLRSGDVVLMAGPARRCFHGVPRIFVDPMESELPDFSAVDQATSGPFLDYIKDSRINVNVRQVY